MRTHMASSAMALVIMATMGCVHISSARETKHGGGSEHEHVLVHFTLVHGDTIERSSQGGDPYRRVTVMPDSVILEAYDGNARLIKTDRLSQFQWRPNPNPPGK